MVKDVMIKILLFFFLLLLPSTLWSQTVTVTGTVLDPHGQVYANGSGKAVLVSGNGSGAVNWTIGGTNPVQNVVPIAALDSFGHFSILVTNTSLVDQQFAQPSWQFSFCSNAVNSQPICFTMTPMAITFSQDISTQIQAQSAPLPSSGGGSGIPNFGQTFVNSTTVTILASASLVNSKNVVVACYDNSVPANMIIPGNINVNPTTLTVIVNFAVAQSGYCVVNSSGGGGGGSGNVTAAMAFSPSQPIISTPSGTTAVTSLPCPGANTVEHGGTPPTCTPVDLTADVINVLPLGNLPVTIATTTGPTTFTGSITGTLPACNSVAWSATPTYTLNFDQCIETTLLGNVTSISIAGTPVNRTALYLHLTQDGVGGRTVTLPGNFLVPTGWTLKTSANAQNNMAWVFDGTFWTPISDWGGGGGGGGGVIPQGANGCVQVQNGGALFCSGNLFDTYTVGLGNILNIKEDPIFSGPSPYVDIRAYGGRIVPQPNGSGSVIPIGVTATTNGTSTITTSAATNLIVGDGITLYHAGAVTALSTPTCPTVTPSLPQTGSATGFAVAAPAGATTYNYKVIAFEPLGSYTASCSVSTTTGQASLGGISVNIATITRSGNVVTVQTATPHDLAVGASVEIAGVTVNGLPLGQGGNDFFGLQTVASVPDSTHFTYASSPSTTLGQVAAGDAGNGAVYWYNENYLKFSSIGTGVFQFAVYRQISGTYTLIGVTHPVSFSGNGAEVYFQDYGNTMTAAGVTAPAWLPTVAPSSSGNKNFTTTITTIVGNSLTLAATPPTTVANTTILFDDAPAFLAAYTAAQNTYSALYLPMGNNNTGTGVNHVEYLISSYLNLTSGPSVPIYFGEQTQFTDTVNYSGTMGSMVQTASSYALGNPQFAVNPGIPITTNANPGFLSTNGINVTGLTFYGGPNTTLFAGSNAASWNYTNMYTSGPTDYNGTLIYWLCQDAPGGCASGISMDHDLLYPGPGAGLGSTMTPAVQLKNIAESKISSIYMVHRGFFLDPNQSGVQMDFNQQYEFQAPNTPLWIIVNYNGVSAVVKIRNAIMDSAIGGGAGNCAVAAVGIPGTSYLSGSLDFEHSYSANICGQPWSRTQNAGFGNGINGYEQTFNQSNVLAPGPGTQAIDFTSGNAEYSATSIVSTGTITAPIAPTCAVGAAGSLAAGTYNFYYQPQLSPTSAMGNVSATSSSCVADGAHNLNVSIPTAIGNALGYIYFFNGPLGSGSFTCGVVNSLSQTITTATPCSPINTWPTVQGPVGMYGNTSWSFNPQVMGYEDYLQISTPTDPPTGYCRNYFDSSSGLMKAINSIGVSCVGSGGGGVRWDNLGNPTANVTPSFFSGGTNYNMIWDFNGTNNASVGPYNTVASTSGVPASSPFLFVEGNEWHGGASVVGGITLQYVPNAGTDAGGTFTVAHTGTATGPVASVFPGSIASGASGGGGGLWNGPEGTCAISLTNNDNLCALASSHQVVISNNGDGPYPATRTIAFGTFTLPTSTILAGSCTAGTVNTSGGNTANILSTDAGSYSWNSDPTAITGYGPVSGGPSLYVQPYVGSGSISVKVCNNDSVSHTPSAATVNWRVIR